MSDWIFKTENGTCGVRASGVLVKNGRILLQREKAGSEYALPGGHLKIGETLENALIREFKEESGTDISVRRLLWTEECFWNGNYSLEYCFQIDAEILSTAEAIPHNDNDFVEFVWVKTDEIAGLTVYPDFLKREISDLSGGIKHFVSAY